MVTVDGDAPGGYDEPHRPQFHYSPARNWLNDPNGLVHHRGEYHLFYQYNPAGSTWGEAISWGHAVSRDLVHWEELPVAIPHEGDEAIFSGSAVVDEHGTSGFGAPGRPAMVAIYTSARPGSQAQSLAYSTDAGRTWTKYAQNPVLDIGAADFRDPKVFWYAPDRRWIMSVALPLQRKVSFYASPDLKRWTHLSDFGPANAVGGIWECPDLVEMPVDGDPGDTRWMLIVSLNPGAVAGGSGTQYFLGSFDGRRFERDAGEQRARWLDYGADNYAAVSFNGAPGDRPVIIGWMSNWRYGNDVPTAPWRGAMTTPRELALERDGGRVELVQRPPRTLAGLRGEPAWREGPRPVADGVEPLDVGREALDLEVTFAARDAERFGVEVHRGDRERTVIGVDARTRELYVDRTESGRVDFDEAFASEHRAPLASQGDEVRLRVLVDASSVEVFADGGRRVITDQLFPSAGSSRIAVFAAGGSASLERLVAYPLRSIWR